MTKPEPMSNLRFVCSEHASRPKPIYSAMPPEYFVGRMVKKAFEGTYNGEPRLEHMWVEITCFEGQTMHGVLNNDPFLEMDIKNGDPVTVELGEIEDVG